LTIPEAKFSRRFWLSRRVPRYATGLNRVIDELTNSLYILGTDSADLANNPEERP
jgi:hypothetical protein